MSVCATGVLLDAKARVGAGSPDDRPKIARVPSPDVFAGRVLCPGIWLKIARVLSDVSAGRAFIPGIATARVLLPDDRPQFARVPCPDDFAGRVLSPDVNAGTARLIRA